VLPTIHSNVEPDDLDNASIVSMLIIVSQFASRVVKLHGILSGEILGRPRARRMENTPLGIC
jgi:hypothetical protein